MEGTLFKIDVILGKDDYNTLIAMLMENFNEKGRFFKPLPVPRETRREAMNLPIRTKQAVSSSRVSLSSQKSNSEETFKWSERSKEAKTVQFKLTLEGFSIHLFKGETNLNRENSERDQSKSLATVRVFFLFI